MTQDTTSYIEMLRKFGSDLGLPKLDETLSAHGFLSLHPLHLILSGHHHQHAHGRARQALDEEHRRVGPGARGARDDRPETRAGDDEVRVGDVCAVDDLVGEFEDLGTFTIGGVSIDFRAAKRRAHFRGGR